MSLNSDLVNAMLDDDAERCIALMKRGANPSCSISSSWRGFWRCDGAPCISYAVSNGMFAAARAMIENGADIFAKEEDFNEEIGPFTLYRICANIEATNLLELVIRKGYDIQREYHYHKEEKGYEGISDRKVITFTAMRAAIKADNSDAIRILLEHGYKCSDEEIEMLVKETDENFAIRAIQNNCKDKHLPIDYLLWAIDRPSIKICEAIISLNPKLAKGDQALDAAVSNDQVGIIRLLIRNGADSSSIGWLRRKFQNQDVLDALDGKS